MEKVKHAKQLSRLSNCPLSLLRKFPCGKNLRLCARKIPIYNVANTVLHIYIHTTDKRLQLTNKFNCLKNYLFPAWIVETKKKIENMIYIASNWNGLPTQKVLWKYRICLLQLLIESDGICWAVVELYYLLDIIVLNINKSLDKHIE